MEVVREIKVLYKNQIGELKTVRELRKLNNNSRFSGSSKEYIYETRLYLNNEYYMNVSCGDVSGNSKKAIQNRQGLKNQFNIEVL